MFNSFRSRPEDSVNKTQHVDTFFLIVKVNIKFTLEEATKVQTGSRCIALLFLQPRL